MQNWFKMGPQLNGCLANFDVMGGPVKLAFQCGAIPYGGWGDLQN